MFEINKVISESISEPFHNPACSSLFENILSESTLGLGMKGFLLRAILLLLRTSFITFGKTLSSVSSRSISRYFSTYSTANRYNDLTPKLKVSSDSE